MGAQEEEKKVIETNTSKTLTLKLKRGFELKIKDFGKTFGEGPAARITMSVPGPKRYCQKDNVEIPTPPNTVAVDIGREDWAMMRRDFPKAFPEDPPKRYQGRDL